MPDNGDLSKPTNPRIYDIADSIPTAMQDWSSVPLEILQTELLRRQKDDNPSDTTRPACGSAKTHHPYNTPLHILALLLILTLSTAACSFPLLIRRFPRLPVPNHALFLSRHFGTGVLIATAFVHLLPTAYVSLTDPCLPRFWNEVYPAMAGFIAMVSCLVVVGVEMGFAMKGVRHEHGGDLDLGLGGEGAKRPGLGDGRTGSGFKRFRQIGEGEGMSMEMGRQEGLYVDEPAGEQSTLNKPLPPEPPQDDSDLDLDELEDESHGYEDTQPLNGSTLRPPPKDHQRRPGLHNHIHSRHTSSPTDPHTESRQILQCLLLEAGILFHSIFIGIALSVSTGPPFYVLLTAISFHQTFEGLALGSRIAAITSFSTSSPKPWLMSFMYGVTTPVGQAIGLGVHGLYDPESEVGLLMVGVVNAVSAGLLVYAGLVQLLAEDFLSEKSYVELRGRRRVQACGSVVGGAMLMAFVGAFA